MIDDPPVEIWNDPPNPFSYQGTRDQFILEMASWLRDHNFRLSKEDKKLELEAFRRCGSQKKTSNAT